MKTRSSLFHIVRQRLLAASYRRLGTIYLYHLRKSSLNFESGTDSLSRNVGAYLPINDALHPNNKDFIYTAAEAWNHAKETITKDSLRPDGEKRQILVSKS